MKVEVKWLLRVPIWPAEQALFRTVFPGEPSQVTVLSREEVVAGKVAALLDRAAPRDLFNMAVAEYSPVLADKHALKTADFTLEEIADLLAERLGPRSNEDPDATHEPG